MSFIVRPSAGYPIAFTAIALFAMTTAATAAVLPEDKCEAAKLRETGKLASCVMSSLAKTTQGAADPDQAALDACGTKFAGKLTAAETKAAGECPTTGDAQALGDAVAALADTVKDSVAGVRFIDNGDGTVTDTEQGVLWQVQSPGGDPPSGVDALYTASDVLVQLGAINGTSAVAGLGGQNNWGLPTLVELQSILNCSSLPCKFVSPLLGPNPTSSVLGQTYMMSGETGALPVSLDPCLHVVVLEDGTVPCIDITSVEGRSRVRSSNNCR